MNLTDDAVIMGGCAYKQRNQSNAKFAMEMPNLVGLADDAAIIGMRFLDDKEKKKSFKKGFKKTAGVW